MDFTNSQLKRIEYFKKSVRLDNPKTAHDPAYQFSNEDLWAILEYSAPIHRGLSIDETPDSEFYMVLLLAKREIYYRLATTTAPFFRIEADDSRIEKNMRFDHYMKLVETVTKEYDKTYETKYGEDGEFGGGTIQVYNAKLYSNRYLQRYNQLDESSPVNLTVSAVTDKSFNLDWDKFTSTHGADFVSYEVYVSEDMIYDEYAYEDKPITVKPLYVIETIRKTKVRVDNLKPNTNYYVLVNRKSRLGNHSFEQILVTTKDNFSGITREE